MKQKSGKENNTKQIKARQGKTIAIVLILLACAALIVCGGFVFLGNSSKNKVTKAQIGGYIVTVPSVYLLAENNEGVFYYNGSTDNGFINIKIEPNSYYSSAEDLANSAKSNPESAFTFMPSEGIIIQDSVMRKGNFEGVWATNNSDSGGYASAVLINDTDYCTITVHAGNDQDINDLIKTLQAIKIKSE